MSHVTDGELHLVLDGALELLSADRAREVREHLEVCGDCGRRLQEERRIRERSQELLRSTDPAAEPPPPFEELRARAGRPAGGAGSSESSRMRGTPWLQGLAWAATVVLALGIGWYAGGRPPGAGPAAGPATEPRPEGAGAARSAPSPRRRDEAAGLAQAAAPEESPRAAEAREEGTVPTPATARTAVTALSPGAGSALAREGSLAVPGLPVLAVEWERSAGGEGAAALRLLQGLPGGDTLVLRYAAADLRGDDAVPPEEKTSVPAAPAPAEALARDRVQAEADAPAPAAAAQARAPARTGEEAGGRLMADRAAAPEGGEADLRGSVLELRRGPWLVEARASLSPDSLRALLERLPPPE